jgi:Icc-related predicted phosphoesterase
LDRHPNEVVKSEAKDILKLEMSIRLKLLAVTDLHCLQHLYAELDEVVRRHRPNVLALVGDFLDCLGTSEPQLRTSQCASAIAHLEVPEIVFVRGNHENTNWREFQDAYQKAGRELNKLHGEAGIFGPAVVIGFPCYLGNDATFAEDKSALPYDPGVWLSKLLMQFGPCMRTLWLMHEPPAGTLLTAPNSPVAGYRDWTKAIHRFSPLLTISGHDHLTSRKTGKWFQKLGSTVSINLGHTEVGPLHYSLVEAEFAERAPSLPMRMRITAYPHRESLDIVKRPD